MFLQKTVDEIMLFKKQVTCIYIYISNKAFVLLMVMLTKIKLLLKMNE